MEDAGATPLEYLTIIIALVSLLTSIVSATIAYANKKSAALSAAAANRSASASEASTEVAKDALALGRYAAEREQVGELKRYIQDRKELITRIEAIGGRFADRILSFSQVYEAEQDGAKRVQLSSDFWAHHAEAHARLREQTLYLMPDETDVKLARKLQNILDEIGKPPTRIPDEQLVSEAYREWSDRVSHSATEFMREALPLIKSLEHDLIMESVRKHKLHNGNEVEREWARQQSTSGTREG